MQWDRVFVFDLYFCISFFVLVFVFAQGGCGGDHWRCFVAQWRWVPGFVFVFMFFFVIFACEFVFLVFVFAQDGCGGDHWR